MYSILTRQLLRVAGSTRVLVSSKNVLQRPVLSFLGKSSFFSSTSISNMYSENYGKFQQYMRESDSGKIIRAQFSKISEEERAAIPGSSCLVTLSIGQPVHYGPHLAATLDLVNKNFGSCTFVFGDTLQRHTMRLITPDISEEKLFSSAKEKGDQWLEKNSHLLSQLQIPWNIRRWDYWLKKPGYPKLLNTIQKTYEMEPAFRKVFDDNIKQYLERLENRGELHADKDTAHGICLRYLQEECAAMCLWIEEGCEYELYANGRTDAMEATYSRFIETLHPNLLKPISLKFKRLLPESLNGADDVAELSKSPVRGFTP